MKNIRNFCIIAHIDHGKSTLADRLLERTKTIEVTEGQMLDDMDLERERGITIKSHAIQMDYQMNGETYRLNLIDTPGHVDFSYEVSRSIAACEGCLLVVDSTQGVQAQTISNLYMAIEHDLEIIPVLNKCDMPNSMPEEVEDEIIELLGCKREEIIRASGRTGQGVDEILRAVASPDFRLRVQSFPRYHRVFQNREWLNPPRRGRAVCQYAKKIFRRRGGRAQDEPLSAQGARLRRRGLHRERHQDRDGSKGGRHDYHRRASLQGSHCGI